MNITELITKVRAWQAANVEYEAACEEPIEVEGFTGYKTTPRRRAAILALDAASKAVTGDVHNDDTLEAFVALADEVQRLQAEQQAILDVCTLKEVYVGNFYKDAVKRVKAIIQSPDREEA